MLSVGTMHADLVDHPRYRVLRPLGRGGTPEEAAGAVLFFWRRKGDGGSQDAE